MSREKLFPIFKKIFSILGKDVHNPINSFMDFSKLLFIKLYPLAWGKIKHTELDEFLSSVTNTLLFLAARFDEDTFAPLYVKNQETIKKVVCCLSKINLDCSSSDILGDAFEYSVNLYISSIGIKSLGAFFTPRHVVKFMVKLINPKTEESVYDPFCGTGGMLIESFKHDKCKIFGGEISDNANIAKMNMILAGGGHNNIKKQDSLKTPATNKYDIVITNMPFSLGKFEEYKDFYKLGSADCNTLCIEHCLDSISKDVGNNRMAIIVPEGILFDRKYTRLREYVYNCGTVECIISLPSGVFLPYTNVKTSVLYLTNVNKKKIQKDVWFFDVKNDSGSSSPDSIKKDCNKYFDKILSNFNSDEEDKIKEGFIKVPFEKIKNNNYLTIAKFYKEDKALPKPHKYKNAFLGELITETKIKNKELFPVYSVTNKTQGLVKQEEQFRCGGSIASKDRYHYKVAFPNDFVYNPARINVGAINCNKFNFPVSVSPMYFSFRITDNKILDHKYLEIFLSHRSRIEIYKDLAIGSVRQILPFSKLKKITIPLPPIEKQKEIVQQFEEELEAENQIILNLENSMNLIDKTWLNLDSLDNDGFEYVKLGDVCEINPPKPKLDDDMEVSFIEMASIPILGYKFKHDIIREYSELKGKTFSFFRNNDVLLAKITPCFENRKCGIATKLKNNLGFGSGELIVLSTNQLISPEYIYLTVSSKKFREEGKNVMTGITGRKRISLDFIKNYTFPLPPLEKQKEIVKIIEHKYKLKNALDYFKHRDR